MTTGGKCLSEDTVKSVHMRALALTFLAFLFAVSQNVEAPFTKRESKKFAFTTIFFEYKFRVNIFKLIGIKIPIPKHRHQNMFRSNFEKLFYNTPFFWYCSYIRGEE
jgi:hypothetical protein